MKRYLPSSHPPQALRPGFHLLARPSGSTCNIDCTYCLFLSKEALYPNEKQRMSEARLELFVKHTAPAMRAMAQLIQQRRYPAEVMTLVAAEDRKRGSYQSCPCGSGLKFRFCHGNRAQRSQFGVASPATVGRPDSNGGDLAPLSTER